MKLKDILKELDLPKGKYVEPTSKDIDDLKGDLFNLVANAMGHDGERENIKNLLKKKSAELKNSGNYVEVSGAAFDSFVGKGGVPTIDSEEDIRKILGHRRSKQTEWHGKHPTKNVKGEGWYTREIGGKRVTKIMIGKVK